MKVIADTNVLLRYLLADDPVQYKLALEIMKTAEAVVVTTVALCELAWVLRSSYGVSRQNIAATISGLREASNIETDGAAVDAGLSMLQMGADFADGVIAHEGRWRGGETFVSFDKKAVSAIATQGLKAILLA
ncbi:MAG: type II toxin-antitoxin system VapC family toxin [Terracidiphilus sp.]|jgi:predicted nucleic-acid-binding protein